MAPIAILFGALLTLLGGGFFVYTGMDPQKITALIPAFFGIPLIVLGVLARSEKLRMHAMHGAALLGLVGFGMPAFMVIKGLIAGDEFGRGEQQRRVLAVTDAPQVVEMEVSEQDHVDIARCVACAGEVAEFENLLKGNAGVGRLTFQVDAAGGHGEGG